MNLFALAARRYIESETYQKCRAAADGNTGRLARALQEAGPVPVLDNAELRQALSLRTFSNLYPFSIDGKAYAGELPGAVNVPQAVETIASEKMQVELGAETSESILATAVPTGTPLPEGQINAGATPTLQVLNRFGVALPVALGVLDNPGQMASFLNRRIELGLNLGLENDILNGNQMWTGAIASVPGGNTVAKSAGYNVDALTNALADVLNAGWYARPPQIVTWPTSKAKVFLERDSSARPLGIIEVLKDWVDPASEGRQLIIPSKFMPAGQALIGDLFGAIALFVHGDLSVEVSRVHLDFLGRSMAEMKLEFRAHSWVREPSALALVTGIA